MGHEERFPPGRLSGSCRFRKRSAVVGDLGGCRVLDHPLSPRPIGDTYARSQTARCTPR